MKTVHSHYENLKVSREAPVEVIKAAFKALMQKYHPDKNQSNDATEIAKIIQQSYEILSDPVSRAAHDRWIKQQEALLNTDSVQSSAPKPATLATNKTSQHQAPVRSTPVHGFGSMILGFFLRGDVLILSLLAGLFLWSEFDRTEIPSKTSPVATVQPSPQSASLIAAVPPLVCEDFYPAHGYEEWLTQRGRLAPLKIKTSSGKNYWMKLVDLQSNQELGLLYVQGGFPFETKVPLGRLELRYAYGDEWCSPAKPFGAATRYSKADSVFEFVQATDGYTGYEVELILQQGGNLQTRKISESEF